VTAKYLAQVSYVGEGVKGLLKDVDEAAKKTPIYRPLG
jgi:hypothetical protein